MQFVNTQYKIIELMQEDKYGSIIKVEDLHKANIVKYMRIINVNKETTEFIEYMKENMYHYINFLHPNTVQYYFFNKILLIDNKPTVSNKYYYTYEYIEGKSLFDFCVNQEFEVLLDIIIQLCSLIKHLHLRNLLICNISSSELRIVNINNSNVLKVLSLFYAEGATEHTNINKDNNLFKAPEIFQNKTYTKSSDIYLIGVILFYMFSGKEMKESNFWEDLLAFKSEENSQLNKIINIIKKCASLNPADRYESVDQIVNNINLVFSKSYKIINKDVLQRMPRFITKPVGRKRHIDKILLSIKDHLLDAKIINSYILASPVGTGKATFLKALEFRIEQEGYIFSLAMLRKQYSLKFYVISYLIKNIIKYVDKEIIEKYSEDLNFIISDEQLLNIKDEDRVRLIYRLGSFILEASYKYGCVILVDNIQYFDKDSIEVIEYLLKNDINANLFIIFALDDFEDIDNTLISPLYESLINSPMSNTIELGNYSFNETSEYIKLILGIENVSLDFITKVFKETEGKPDYIYEIIFALFTSKNIYVEDDGFWNFQEVDFEKLNMTFNINDITLNKINSLSSVYQEILKIIAVFNTAASFDILDEMTEINGEELLELLDYLTYINVLSRKVDDWGISYDFSSLNLKKLIYERINDLVKLKYHNKASYILEDKFLKENRENKDELVFHMTRANRHNEAIDYLIISAKKMIDSNLINQAIQFLEQAFDLFKNDESDNKKIKVCFKLGDLYDQVGNYLKSMHYYSIAEDISEKVQDIKVLVDSYIKKFSLLYKLNRYRDSIQHMIKATRIIKEIKYYEGLYELTVNMSEIMINRRKYSSYIKILEKCINNIDKVEHRYYYARIMIVYGRVLIIKNRYEEGLNILLKCVNVLEKLGSYEYLPVALNTIGYVYSDYYNDMQKSREYYEKNLSISQKTNNLRYMEYSYNNLAELYRIEDKYIEAVDYYNNALEVIKTTHHKFSEGLINLNIMMVNLAMEDYNKVYQSFDICNKILNESKDLGNLAEYVYYNKSEYFYIIGDFEKAKAYAQKTVDMCISWGVDENSEANLVKILADSQLDINMKYDEHMGFCVKVFGDNLYKIGRVACVRLAEIYVENKMYYEASKFLELGRSYISKIDTEILRLEYEYIEIEISSCGDKLNRYIKLSLLLEDIESNGLKCKVYRAIADEYMCNENYQEALKYYISSLNFLRKLVHNVPEEYKIKFVSSHSRNKIKEGLIRASEKLKSKSKRKNLTVDRKKLSSIINIDKYFDYTDYIDIYRYRENEPVSVYMYNKYLFKIQQLVNRFSEDNLGNLKDMINMFSEIIQAKNGFIATLDEDDNINVLATYNRYFESPFYKYIIEQVRQKKDSIIVTDAFEYSKKKGDILIPKDIAAVFCIPIMGAKEEENLQLLEDKRRNKVQTTNQVIGYIYMDVDSIINNFTEETSKFCMTASKISYILVDNYNLRIVSAIDKLTKLYTRKYFETALINELLYAEKESGEFCIIMIDIDKFKTVNDRFGHQKGDEILQNVSSIIMSSVRKGDICGRYGGEEIIVLLPGTNAESGEHVAEKIRRKVENSKLLGLHSPLTISLGVASYPEHSTWAKDLIEKADQALYYAKESGRNMSCVYQQNMSKSVKRMDKLAGIISGNLVEDQRKVESMLEVLELQRNTELSFEEKIFKFLGRIIEVSEAQTGIIYHINEKREKSSKVVRKKFMDTEVKDVYCSEGIVKKCMDKQSGEYIIDWGNYPGIDSVTGMPDWQSIIVVPFIKGEIMKGLLYLSVSVKDKEFDAGAFNFIKTLCDIISAIY